MQRFKSAGSAQRFLSVHAAVYNTFNLQPSTFNLQPSTFNLQRHLISRTTLRTFRAEAASQWRAAVTAA
jgi:hypothetical protein